MKQILFFLFFLPPFFANAQCDNYVNATPELTTAIVAAAQTYLQVPLDTARVDDGRLTMKDEKDWCTVSIYYNTKSDLVGSEARTVQTGIRSIYIAGPWDRIQKLYAAYFLPKTSCGTDYSATVRFWNGQKIVHVQQGARQGIELGFIQIESK